MAAILAAPLEAHVLRASETDGIVTEEVTFHSETDGSKRVEIFAFFSYPKGARRLPAYVWNQGGGARAEPGVTQLGARRGYGVLCIDLPMPGYRSTGDYPIVSGLELTPEPRQAPIAHGAVALLRAVSFLASRPEVDPARIGMAGSSWGGFFATLQAGLDPRLKAVASMFGAGGLDLGNPWWDARGRKAPPDAATRERWRTTLDPALRLPASRAAIAWFSGTNDQFYWMPALSKTFEAAKAPKHLTLLPNWNHALTASLDEQVLAWLDAHLKGGPGFPETSGFEVLAGKNGVEARFKFSGPRPIASATVILSAGEAGHWPSRCWTSVSATVLAGVATARLPASSLPLFVAGTVTDALGFQASTAVVRIEPSVPANLMSVPACDGAAAWGGFESPDEEYLSRHGLKLPELRREAFAGQRSAVLQGKMTLAPLHFTAGVPNRFSCRMKADRPVAVQLSLFGRFDGEKLEAPGSFDIGTSWTEVALDYTPPPATLGSLDARVVVPPGVRVLCDAVSLRPVDAGRR